MHTFKGLLFAATIAFSFPVVMLADEVQSTTTSTQSNPGVESHSTTINSNDGGASVSHTQTRTAPSPAVSTSSTTVKEGHHKTRSTTTQSNSY